MKLKALLLCHIILAILISSFVWPVTKAYWDILDMFVFKMLNEPMRGSPLLQNFWAMANHRYADWVEDVVILGFYLAYIFKPSKTPRTRKAAQVVFLVLLIGSIIFFVNRMFFREHLRILRDSPTLVDDNAVRLSIELNWLNIKDVSSKCFPADHATTALLFSLSYAFFTGIRKLSLFAFLYSIFLCLPRMATGAHWISDVIIGSGTLITFFLSWTLFTPVHEKVINALERFFCIFKRQKEIKA